MRGELTRERMYEIVREKGFAESTLTIPQNINDTWRLIMPNMTTPLKNIPNMPLTDLQKRWFKALLSDPKIKLFGVTDAGIEDVEPLYDESIFEFYDRYGDGDDYESPDYIAHFRII